ncbi:MAG: hypothetical protein ACREUU_10790 [Gammaproteobacteria bacterium]
MPKKPLIETNPHLRDPEKLRKALIANVASSMSIETGTSAKAIARALSEGDSAKPANRRRVTGR